jgi:hypothetical protein
MSIYKQKSKTVQIVALIFAFVGSIYSLQSNCAELILQAEDSDTLACIEGVSMRNYRDRCAANFPELKGKVENAYHLWLKANAESFKDVSAACSERIKLLNEDDPARLKELRKYAEHNRAQLIAPIDKKSIKFARADCHALIDELNSSNSAIPKYLSNKLRAVTLKADLIDTNLQFADSPIELELRLISDQATDDSEMMNQRTSLYDESRSDTFYVQKISLIGSRPFSSFKTRMSKYENTAEIALGTNAESGKLLEQFTRNNLRKKVALVLNREVLFVLEFHAPVIAGDGIGFLLPIKQATYIRQKVEAALAH